MRLTAKLRVALLLVAFLPQLVLLGLGHGLVVCIAPGGHAQLELTGESCCDEVSVDHDLACDEAATDGCAHECGDCSDYTLELDSLVSRRGDLAGPSLDLGAAPCALLAPAPPFEATTRARGLRARPVDRSASHLTRMRGVVLRC